MANGPGQFRRRVEPVAPTSLWATGRRPSSQATPRVARLAASIEPAVEIRIRVDALERADVGEGSDDARVGRGADHNAGVDCGLPDESGPNQRQLLSPIFLCAYRRTAIMDDRVGAEADVDAQSVVVEQLPADSMPRHEARAC